MNGIYEELFQGLLNEGIDDDIATAVVNKIYENEELHNVEVLDEGLFRAATAIGKMMLKGPFKNVAKNLGTGAKVTRGTGYGTLRQAQNLLNLPRSQATVRRGLRANWSPSRALPASTARTGGGSIVKDTSKTAQLGAVPKVEPVKSVKVKDLGAVQSSGGPTRYQGTRSGGQIAGTTNKALPGTGATASRQNTAAQRLRDAATGTTGTRTIVGRSKDFPTLSGRVRNALAAAGGVTASTVKQGVKSIKQGGKSLVKGAGTAVKGAGKLVNPVTAAAGGALIGYSMSGGGSKPVADTKPDTAPTTPPGGVVADKGKKDDTKGPGGYTIPDAAKPKTRLDAALTGIKPGAGVPSREDELKAIRDKAKADTIAKGKNRPFDIRDRDIRARANYDPRFDKRKYFNRRK